MKLICLAVCLKLFAQVWGFVVSGCAVWLVCSLASYAGYVVVVKLFVQVFWESYSFRSVAWFLELVNKFGLF